MPATIDPSDNSGERHQKTRLESEIEEILARAEREHPLPPPTPIRTRTPRPTLGQAHRSRLAGTATSVRGWLVNVPLLVAYMLAIVAHLLSDLSPFLTRIVVDLAVVAVFWPILESFRQQQATPSNTMWRGREMDLPMQPQEPSPWSQFRQWLRDRRILP